MKCLLFWEIAEPPPPARSVLLQRLERGLENKVSHSLQPLSEALSL